MNTNIILDTTIRAWASKLEQWLPMKLNGTCSPGEDVIIRYKYIPSSARIDEIVFDNENFPGPTKRYLTVGYQVERSLLGNILEGEFSIDYLHGAITIPVEEGDMLRLSDIHPLDGILDLTETE